MAYGARLESVLGESPRGFESPILRQLLCTAGCRPPRGRAPARRELRMVSPMRPSRLACPCPPCQWLCDVTGMVHTLTTPGGGT